MIVDPRPHSRLRPAALLAALLLLPLGPAACGPDPAEVDRSPVAGMSEENPGDDPILGDDISLREADAARLTLTGTPAFDGTAAAACAIHESPAAPHAAPGHAEPGEAGSHGDAREVDADHAGESPADAGHADADHTETEIQADSEAHEPAEVHVEGDHGAGHLTLARVARFTLTPAGSTAPDGQPLRVVVEVPDYESEGTYPARFRVETQAEDGTYAESVGEGTATLTRGTLLSTEAATHWITAEFQGDYAGQAGNGRATGSVDRCYFFK